MASRSRPDLRTGLVLRDNGYTVDEGLLFYYETGSACACPISDALVQQTTDAAGRRA